MSIWEWIVLLLPCMQVMFPVLFPGTNRWLWKKTFFWSNYAMAVLLAIIWLQLRPAPGQRNIVRTHFLFLSPIVFYSLYCLFDKAIWYMYKRRLVITGKGVERYNPSYNAWDQVFTCLMVAAALLVPILLFGRQV